MPTVAGYLTPKFVVLADRIEHASSFEMLGQIRREIESSRRGGSIGDYQYDLLQTRFVGRMGRLAAGREADFITG
jgi:hypothetical protein